jgi:hypothetical protein
VFLKKMVGNIIKLLGEWMEMKQQLNSFLFLLLAFTLFMGIGVGEVRATSCPSDEEFLDRAIFAIDDYLSNPGSSVFTLEELKDLIFFYITNEMSTADCSQSGRYSGNPISSTLNKCSKIVTSLEVSHDPLNPSQTDTVRIRVRAELSKGLSIVNRMYIDDVNVGSCTVGLTTVLDCQSNPQGPYSLGTHSYYGEVWDEGISPAIRLKKSETKYFTVGGGIRPTVSISASKTSVNVGETFTLTVSAQTSDSQGIDYINVCYPGGTCPKHFCNGLTSCSNPWSRSESSSGSYTYTGHAIGKNGLIASNDGVGVTVQVGGGGTTTTTVQSCSKSSDCCSVCKDPNSCGRCFNNKCYCESCGAGPSYCDPSLNQYDCGCAGTTGCQDSDGGKDYNTKGTCSGENGDYTESCDGNRVNEYFCVGDYCSGPDKYTCPSGCSDGKCL